MAASYIQGTEQEAAASVGADSVVRWHVDGEQTVLEFGARNRNGMLIRYDSRAAPNPVATSCHKRHGVGEVSVLDDRSKSRY